MSAIPFVFPTCPALIRNVSGSYSFRCTTNWKYANCETGQAITIPNTWLINPQGCYGEAYHARMMLLSEQGDHSVWDSPGTQQQSSQPVVVAGVSGTRRTYLVTSAELISPEQGTIEVVYTFVTGGRTLFAKYDHYPSEQDLTMQFDQMVTTSLRFSA